MAYDIVKFLEKQRAFSEKTFGPGDRTAGIIDHIRKELNEIEQSPHPLILEEIIDVVILAFDMTWRLGFTPSDTAKVLDYKLEKNMKRKWPDWRSAPSNKAIEHDRSGD